MVESGLMLRIFDGEAQQVITGQLFRRGALETLQHDYPG